MHDDLDPFVDRDECHVRHDAGDLHDHIGFTTSSPVISRSTQTSRSSTSEVTLGSGTRRTLSARGPRVDSTPVTAPPVVWRPTPDLLRDSNITRFMDAEGIGDFAELVKRSIDEPEWFWDTVVQFLDLRFSEPYTAVLDTSDGIAWATWFVGGRCNLASTCVDRHADDLLTRDGVALVWEGEEGTVRTLTFGELQVAHRPDRGPDLAARGVPQQGRGWPLPADGAGNRRRVVHRSRSLAPCSYRSSPATAQRRSRSGSRTQPPSRWSPPTDSYVATRWSR